MPSTSPERESSAQSLAAINSQHRRQLELNKQQYDYDLQKREQSMQAKGQVFAFIIAMTAIAGGLLLAWFKAPWPGAVISGSTIVSLVTAFLKTRRPPKSL